jgi:flap endonuclease-1
MRHVGLPFRDLVRPEELPWESLAGRSVAVDAYNAVYQFLATIRQRDGQPFSDPEGRVTSHLIGILGRTTSLLGQGVLPVWVFDGKPPDLKAGTLRSRFLAKEKAETAWKEALAAGDLETARKKAAQTSRFTRSMADEARELLEALGVPTVQAPSEGEAQGAAMAAQGVVWASASEDYDSLLFGAPRLVRGLAARGTKGSAPAAQIVDRARTLEELGISGEELLMIGLLVGTDFSDGVRGIGPKKALKLVREHLGWDATLARVGLDPAEVAPVAELFRHPDTVAVGPIAQRPTDAERVRRILVDRHAFSPERVDGALARAKRRPATSGPTTVEVGHQTMLDSFDRGAA